ncbi:hypothetical protein [Rhodopirellula bahusiensis]|uniref:hypothetical protein n=1 Tax=Rhodopirellula bahusiensis TaxID=2014065 RepID=UPI00329688AA
MQARICTNQDHPENATGHAANEERNDGPSGESKRDREPQPPTAHCPQQPTCDQVDNRIIVCLRDPLGVPIGIIPILV